MAMTRKDRERLEREERILQVAQELFIEKGYAGLSMEEIAHRIEYAKGTVYGHFRSKEDILTELASRAVDKRAEMFSKAAAFRGRSRERMTALGLACELFVRLFPHFFAVEVILRTETLREKADEERLAFLRACESRCMGIVAGIARDGVAAGDLDLPEGFSAEGLTFGLWSMTYGAYSLRQTGTPLVDLGVNDPFKVVMQNAHFLLDGLGWRPLSTEWDYDATGERAAVELFGEELAIHEAP